MKENKPAAVMLTFLIARIISDVTGICLLEASDVPDVSAKYLTRPGQVTKASPFRIRYHHFLNMVL